jgi:hypothetical protein
MNYIHKIIFLVGIVLICLWGLYANANCQTLGDEFQVNTYTPSGSYPSVAFDDSGRAIISWTSSDSDERGVFAQRFDAFLLPLGSEFQVNTTTFRDQYFPMVEATADGDFVIGWRSNQGFAPDYWDLYLFFFQRYDNAGYPIGSETVLSELGGEWYKNTSFIALSDSGEFEGYYIYGFFTTLSKQFNNRTGSERQRNTGW